MSLSQSRNTSHPAARSNLLLRRSRATLAAIFLTQYSLLWPRASFSSRFLRLRPCQKSPSAKATAFSWGNTKSGQPGSEETFVRNLRPSARKARRSINSHRVPRLRLAAAATRLETADAGRKPAYDTPGTRSTANLALKFRHLASSRAEGYMEARCGGISKIVSTKPRGIAGPRPFEDS